MRKFIEKIKSEDPEQVPVAVRSLIRMGDDRILGYLKGGMHAWEVSGRAYERIGAVHASTLQARRHGEADFTLLDLRKKTEFAAGRLHGATHIFPGDLQDHRDEIDKDKPVITFCDSGRRATIAASILKRNGFIQLEDALGSLEACKQKQIGCDIEEG